MSNVTAMTAGHLGGAAARAGAISANGEVSDLFVRLLVAQVRNQNPLEPSDPSEFVNQLTQLSQMEALSELSAQTRANAGMLESLQVIGLGAQVGAELAVTTEHVDLAEEPVKGRIALTHTVESLSLVIEDDFGRTQRLPLGTRDAGDVEFRIDPQALGLAPGRYRLSVVGADEQAAPRIEVFGTLEAVRLSPAEGVVLQVAHLGQVPPGAVSAFNGRPATPN